MMALTIAEAARAQLEPDVSLSELLMQYMRNGLVHVEPGLVVLAHECHYASDEGKMTQDRPGNAWFIRLAARVGCRKLGYAEMVKDFLRVIGGDPQTWLLWCRRNDGALRAHRMQDLQRLTK
jgi:hypothetical protein